MATSTGIPVKLFIDTKKKKLIFAEAGSHFIDFLFGLLTLPLRTVTTLLKDDGSTPGCIDNVYQSVQNMNFNLIEDNQIKSALLSPAIDPIWSAPLATMDAQPEKTPKYYRCNGDSPYCREYVATVWNDQVTYCVGCNKKMKTLTLRGGMTPVKRMVKDCVFYMVADDLTVTPMTCLSSLLKKLNVNDIIDLQEKVVYVGPKEGRRILGASLKSKTVLSDVFLQGYFH